MKIEIFGTGCPKCKRLFQNTEEAAKDLNLEAEIAKVEDIQKIMNAGIMMTPAFAVDGEVKSAGKVLSVDEIKRFLNK
ncbi:MAG: TM0996/MTH895 family glutaredoxin-like protein [Deltaproteobacteria bacterium]|nr:TM0996/MTH895 family glutaredoxin-like protein [Deltaproteobacteria bacterium]